MNSIISNLNKINYKNFPFPHFIVKNALDKNFFNQLDIEYGILESYFQGLPDYNKNNIGMQINLEDLHKIKLDMPVWKKFMEYHSSDEFTLELYEIFKDEIENIYPNIKKNILNFTSRFISKCQPGINTPVKRRTSVRAPHLDKYNTLFSGLFYMRKKNDNSAGGDLELYKTKKNQENLFYSKCEVSNLGSIEIFEKLEYQENVFICFLNTPKSIHAVTPREVTQENRRLINFITKVPNENSPLFKVKRDKNYLRVMKNNIRDLFYLGK